MLHKLEADEVRKKTGSNYTVYLPDHLMSQAKLIADATDRSASFVVAVALKKYIQNQIAPNNGGREYRLKAKNMPEDTGITKKMRRGHATN